MPYCFPLYGGTNTPVWDWHTILLSYLFIPKRKKQVSIPFDYDSTLIMVESGGFIKNPPSNQMECLKMQLKITPIPDIVLPLDYPVKKGSGKEHLTPLEKDRWIQKTVENAELLMQTKEREGYEFEPMGIIHGYSLRTIGKCAFALKEFGYEFYAIGSITTQAGARSTRDMIDTCKEVRAIIGENVWLHLLGVMDWKKHVALQDAGVQITSFDASSLTQMPIRGKIHNVDGSIKYIKRGYKSMQERIQHQETEFHNMLEKYRRYLWKNN
jgi:tRNA-guanine family transglycosylase